MNGILLNIKNAFLRVFYQKTISIVVIVSIAIGMIFPLSAFAMANDIIENIKATKFTDTDSTIILEYFSSFAKKEIMDQRMGFLMDIDQYGYFSYYKGVVSWKGQDMAGSVAGATLSYFELENYTLMEGKMFNREQEEKGMKVCLLRKDGVLWQKGVRVGDIVKINGTGFKVIGMIRDPKIYGELIAPYNSLNIFLENNPSPIQYKALLHTKRPVKIDELRAKIKANAKINLLSVMPAAKGQKIFFDSAGKVMIQNLLLGFFVLLFGIISFIFIIAGKVAEEEYSIGVKMAIGASKNTVFFELFIQSVLLIMTSIILDLLCFPIIQNKISQLGFMLDWKVVLIMIGIGFVLAFAVSGIIFQILIRKKAVCELLKGGSC